MGLSIAALRKQLPRTHKIAKKLNDVVDSVYDVISHEDAAWKPRASSLPICVPLMLQEFLSGKKFEKDYPFDFYTKTGTAIHDTLQGNFPKSKHGSKVFGNWRCSRHNDPDKPCKFTLEHTTVSGLDCPKCKKGKLEYVELNLLYTSKKDKTAIISGHCDLVSCYKKGKKKKFIVWEFKSCGDWNIKNPDKFLPYSKHLFQAWAYALMLSDMGYRPSYIAIGYFSRDKAKRGDASKKRSLFGGIPTGMSSTPNPKDKTSEIKYFKVTDKRLAVIREIMEYEVEQVRLGQNVMNKKNAVDKRANLIKLHKNRPCKSQADYESFMAHHWFSTEKCEFAKPGRLGGCFTDDVKTKLFKKTLKLAYA